jgi:riboflavin biosynthesis pyrimidine reductase
MRVLLPAGTDSDAALDQLRRRDDRPCPPERPWVMANMVTSVDGAYSVEGRSGGLSSDADRQVFHRLRAAADAVLVAAGTARTERYRRPRTGEDQLAFRRAQGLEDHPRLVLVSRSLSFPSDLPLLEASDLPEPLVLHPADADPGTAPPGVALRSAGADGVDMGTALEGLRADGVRVVLCEGGPHLLGQLHEGDLIDELFVTFSPHLVGGGRTGLLGAARAELHRMSLHRLLEDDGFLLATYRRTR